MPINLKHLIVVGLGIGVAGAYCFNQSKTNQEEPVAMQQSAEFKPLSMFEPLAQAPKLDFALPASSEELVETPMELAQASMDLALPLADEMAAAPQTQLTRPEPAVDPTSSLELSPVVMDEEEYDFDELASEMITDFESDSGKLDSKELAASDEPMDLSLEETITISQTGLAQTDADTIASDVQHPVVQAQVPTIQRQHSLPGSAWEPNPFLSNSHPANMAPASAAPISSAPARLAARPGFQANKFALQSNENLTNSTTGNAPVYEVAQRQSGQVRSLNDLPLGNARNDAAATEQIEGKSVLLNANETQSDYDFNTSPESSVIVDERTFDMSDTEFSETGIAPVSTALPESAAQQAAHHIEYGKSLSRRGASFAARQEFYSALRVIAQANDANIGGNNFSESLGRAIMIMKEAEDFVIKNPQSEVALNVVAVIDSHRSKVITIDEAQSMTPAAAVQRYYSVAQEQLDFAGGRNVVAAEVFFCLGKLQTALMKTQTVPGQLDAAQAIVFHQVAIQSDNNHYRSANELGVLLAKTGQLERATKLFKQSLITKATTQAWQNLAKTHARLGEQKLAQLAQSEAVEASQVQVANSSAGIQWMPTTQFNASAPIEYQERVASKSTVPPANLPEKKADSKEDPKPKSLSERIKDLF